MRFLITLVVALITAAGSTFAQSYHDPVYLFGGYEPNTLSMYPAGVFLLNNRGSQPSMTQLCKFGRQCRFSMDVDNRNVLVGVEGTNSINTLYAGIKSGLFRFDPTTKAFATINSYTGPSTLGFYSFYDTVIDHNGDYISGAYAYDPASSKNNGYFVWKIDRSGTQTTLLSTPMLGRSADFRHKLIRNIDTGRVLVVDSYIFTPRSFNYQVLEIDTDTGTITTWNSGQQYGWGNGYSMPQNHRNGLIEGVLDKYVYQLKPGAGSRTTLATINGLPYGIFGAGRFDLQTASRPRQVYTGFGVSPSQPQTYLYYIDASTWTVTSFAVSSLRTVSYAIDFYQGRSTQSVKVGPRKWDIHLSDPAHPGRAYVVAASMTGVRPGVPLPDGRRINLFVDPVTMATANNLIRPYWDSGPGVLNALGGAKATLDLSGFDPVRAPLWVTWLVLDPNSPTGIAVVHDTYVMRI